MDLLKKFFPLSFSVPEKDTKQLVVNIIIYVVVGAVLSVVFGWLAAVIRFVGFIFSLLGSLAGTYCTAGIVLAVLKFCNVLK